MNYNMICNSLSFDIRQELGQQTMETNDLLDTIPRIQNFSSDGLVILYFYRPKPIAQKDV